MGDGGSNVYGYDAFNKLAWAAVSGTPTCGSSGKCIIYDAFGRMVEKSSASAWTEIWYTQVPGSQITMSGTTASYAYWPSPGRGTFIASGTNMFLHQDWLGNDRVVSATTGHTVTADRAYAPYGEQYNAYGSTNPVYGMFAGITGDFDPGVLFDTPNRELAQYQGRWLSPDPAGAGWNQYAYVTNPNSEIDPSGLDCLINCDDPGSWGWDGGSGFTGNDYFTGAGCDPTVSASCIFTPYTPFPGVGQGWGSPGGADLASALASMASMADAIATICPVVYRCQAYGSCWDCPASHVRSGWVRSAGGSTRLWMPEPQTLRPSVPIIHQFQHVLGRPRSQRVRIC
jgi:RHS repeat-associated protein